MAIIDSIKDKLNNIIYPKTVTKAVYNATTKERLDNTLLNKQDKTDGTLKTIDKSIVGGINEISTGLEQKADKSNTLYNLGYITPTDSNYTTLGQLIVDKIAQGYDGGFFLADLFPDLPTANRYFIEYKTFSTVTGDVEVKASMQAYSEIIYIRNLYSKTGIWTKDKWIKDSTEQDLEHKVDKALINLPNNYKDNTALFTDYPLGFSTFRAGDFTGLMGGIGYCEVITIRTLDTATQIVTYANAGANDSFIRNAYYDSWRNFKKLATTDKVDILITPANSYSVNLNHSYKINNVLYFNFNICKTDGTAFSANTYIGNIVTNFSYKEYLYKYDNIVNVSAITSGGMYYPVEWASLFSNGIIYVGKILGTDTLQLSIFGVVLINI